MDLYPAESITFIINHVILPPKLPQEADDSKTSRTAEQHLLRLLSSTADSYCNRYQQTVPNTPSACRKTWGIIKTMLLRCATVISAQNLSTELLTGLFAELMVEDVLLLPIKAQNAMLTLRRTNEMVVFECFEAAPLSSAVMGCRGSLLRTFPAQARAIPASTFDDPRFRTELAAMLSKLDMEVIDEMMPQSKKAGSKMAESRETAHPGLVSDMLMAILASLGEPVEAHVISKRTRDDVLWSNTLLPWRRSPLWLAIRVTVQTILCREFLSKGGNIHYKNLMICLMSEIASVALFSDEPADRCHVILAKLARRVHKLGAHTNVFVQEEALSTCQRVRARQSLKWEELQKVDANRRTTIQSSTFASDTALSLHTSRPYLDAVLADSQNNAPLATSFTPACQTWQRWDRGLPRINTSSDTKEELVYILAEVENWVAISLPSWVAKFDSCSPAPEDCIALASLGEECWRISETAYTGAPEQLSIMILVIAELWHALDCLATSLFPLLKQYSPVVSTDLFSPLLLPKKFQMERLQKVEQHLKSRLALAMPGNPSIFSDPRSRSFAEAYYVTSSKHRNLRTQIEAEASVLRAAKKSEWEKASQKYQQLVSEAEGIKCQQTTDVYGWTVHSPSCKKCKLNIEASDMRITKYEWPLPTDEDSCISAVFELDCPAGFVAWRNLTWMLTHDIGRSEKISGERYADTLHAYSGLRRFSQERSSRIILASMVKSFEKTHYTQNFPVDYDEIYSNNALKYKMLDQTQFGMHWVEQQTGKQSLHHKCIQLLPEGPYKNLQFAVNSTHHAQNDVLAKQDICSHALSLHEFISFGSLRADGEKTQWLNIQRELTASNLSLNTESVSMLFLRTAFQVGSSGGNAYRTSHCILEDPSFCEELLAKIQETLNTVKANWKTDYAMMLLVNLALRTLSLALNEHLISLALETLKRIRAITMEWMEALRDLVHRATEDTQIQNLQQRLLKIAMLCKLTFDVDSSHIEQVLGSDCDLSTWVVSCMVVRENIPSDLSSTSSYTHRMYLHDLKLTHGLHRVVLQFATRKTTLGLDRAISKIWPSFRSSSSGWDTLASPNQRWVTIQTKPSSGCASQKVLYNILDGELFVDGRPLGRLPREYLNSEAYRRVFGSQIINVFAANMPGMLYMTAQKFHDYLAYFTLRDGKVVIKLRQGLQVLEYVPHDVFVGDMPSSFVSEYVHWLDLSSHEIEFRPLKQPLNRNTDNWCLRYYPRSFPHLFQSNQRLIDVRSPAFTETTDVFRALERWQHTHVFLDADHRLHVHLPRFDLHFFLNTQDHFQCHELDRIVDPDQSLGTMIGLKSRLVLCGIGQLARKHDRLLVVPHGKVSILEAEPHVSVTVKTSGHKIRLFRYQIDGILRRLQGPGDITSTLYRAYLHAVTSYVLSDPFTGHTGTEEALTCLQSQSISLTRPADKEIVELLKNISELTPVRRPYPKHLRVMQQVEWNPQLSMIAQNDDFIVLAQQILSSGERYLIFYPDNRETPSLYTDRDMELLARAKLRNSAFHKPSSGNVVTNQCDAPYQARDHLPLRERADRTFSVASLVREWPQKCEVTRRLWDELQTLGILSEFGTSFESSKPLLNLLELPFGASWGSLLELCRHSSQQRDCYRLLFLFSTIAFGQQIIDLVRLVTLLAFAFSPELRAIGSPPPHPSFTLTHGITFHSQTVQGIIEDHMKEFTPSRIRSQRQVEARNYYNDKAKQTNSVLAHYSGQWPCNLPHAPESTNARLLNINAAGQKIHPLFSHWTRNGEFQNYISRVQSVLDRIYENHPARNYPVDDWQTWHTHPRLDATPLLPTLLTLMSALPPSLPQIPEAKPITSTSQASSSNPKLRGVIELLSARRGDSSIRKQYSDELVASLDA